MRGFPLLIPLLALISGCGMSAYDSSSQYYKGATEHAVASSADADEYFAGGLERRLEAKPAPAAERAAPNRPSDKAENPVAGENAQAFARKIVYTARFVVDVFDIEKSREEIVAWTESLGGYMHSQRAGTVVLKVPAEKFPEVLTQLRKAGRVNDDLTDIRAQDITQEFYDLELRLKTRKEYLASLSELLKQAGKLEEKLAVQREVANVLADIEQMEGKLRVMVHMVAFATVTVEFRPAYKGPTRTFKLPWDWLDRLGVEYLFN